ncbi:MAG: heparinase II/III family protein, partial [Pirellulales bacterium]|nr:heparinase II/III family protein [Pirellulales bacterium]
IYGQWKQGVLGGIQILAQAYVVTGDPVYARKAGILLARVADLYPSFDFATQGFNYERQGTHGYLGNWHDACEETRELAMAYDRIFDGIKNDAELVKFLSEQARHHGLENPKTSFADIQRNVETGILRDALANRHKISSNYPRTDIAIALIKAILQWPASRDEVYALIDAMITRATAVDGVTGEKGLANYSAFGTQSLAVFLAEWDRADRGFLERCLKTHPKLYATYRFHIDTWCLQKYYPLVGDTGWFAARFDLYQGVRFPQPGDRPHTFHGDGYLRPSMYSFLWDLYRLTGDAAFVQILYRANGNAVEDLPRDLFAEDAEALREGVAKVIAEQGADLKLGSVNKQEWRLAILRSGSGENARAVWLNYQAGGGHGHRDGMNLGLFAHGLDLMPEFGYPAVQYGGWGSPRGRWYTMSAAHNTVVVDGQDHANQAGQTTLWADGSHFRALRASAPGMIPAGEAGPDKRQFERTIVQVDVPGPAAFYVLDVFRVVGGRDHAKFMHSHFGKVTTAGLAPGPGDDYGFDTQMRNFRWDAGPQPGWSVEWQVEDRGGLLPAGQEVHLRYTGLTPGARVGVAEAWISYGGYGADLRQEAWIPRLVVRRKAEAGPLASTFVSVIEPYQGTTAIRSIRRLPVTTEDGRPYPESTVAVEVTLADGTQDLLLAADVENPLGQTPSVKTDRLLVEKEWGVFLTGELCLVRRTKDGNRIHVSAANTRALRVNGQEIENDSPENLLQWNSQ